MSAKKHALGVFAALLVVTTLLGACRSTGTPRASTIEIQQWGTLREALREGRSEGRVMLGEVVGDGVYGVGALAGLVGEVTIADGELFITCADSTSSFASYHGSTDREATLLVAGQVQSWIEVSIDEDVDGGHLDEYIQAAALREDIDPSRPFLFTVEGTLLNLHAHILAGQCPMRAQLTGEELERPPYEFVFDRIEGQLVGVYAEKSAGTLTHAGQATHIHTILSPLDAAFTAHVDSVSLGAGSTLRIGIE